VIDAAHISTWRRTRPGFVGVLLFEVWRSPCSRSYLSGGTAAVLHVLASLTIALAIDGAQSRALPRSDTDLGVTIRVHDYAHVPSQSLSRASESVTRLYATIGVQTEWYDVLRFPIRRSRGSSSQEGAHGAIADLTINILTPEMAARGRIQPDVLGFAVVPPEGMGRIAYVIYDRVQHVAAGAATSEVDLLGFVMAHEIAHLLGLRSDASLVKCHWDRQEVRQMNVRNLEIPPLQASRIRSTLEQASGSLSRAATEAGSRGADRR
jgi:hypothetical protein